MSRLDPADLNARMGSYFTAHVASSDPSGLVPIALDGKMLRGALRAKATATHLVSVFAHRARLVLGQLAVAEKSNEIPCVRALLTLLPGSLRWLVTVDAMHTQVVTAKLICATLKSHYLMIVKSNQAKIFARITALPWAEVPTAATDDSAATAVSRPAPANHHRCTRNRLPYAKQIIRITRERLITATDQRSVEVVYAICSLPFEHARPTAIMTWMRQHWGIENSLHWIRDVTFDEDRQRAHTGNGAQVLATLRNTAINLHRLNGADNIAEACRITALTANRRLDLLNPQSPAHKPANQQRRSPGDDPHAIRWRGDQLAGLPDRISDLPRPAAITRRHPIPTGSTIRRQWSSNRDAMPTRAAHCRHHQTPRTSGSARKAL
ncbi:ISAs1 family transposase (plasmid) [Mycobacterium ulcerans]|nr:ISAs1 family transposase [Mycobacterium ulcerans]